MTTAAAVAAGLIPSFAVSEPIGAHPIPPKLGTVKTSTVWDARRSAWLITGHWKNRNGIEYVAGEYFVEYEKKAQAFARVLLAFQNRKFEDG